MYPRSRMAADLCFVSTCNNDLVVVRRELDNRMPGGERAQALARSLETVRRVGLAAREQVRRSRGGVRHHGRFTLAGYLAVGRH